METNGTVDVAHDRWHIGRSLRCRGYIALRPSFHATEEPLRLTRILKGTASLGTRKRLAEPRATKGARVPGTGNVPPTLFITLNYIRSPTGSELSLLVGHVPPERHYV